MQIGSIVELTNDRWDPLRFKYLTQKGCRYPSLGQLYTVREINETDGVRLEEIRNPKIEFKVGLVEMGFKKWRFKEVLPPIPNVEEWVNQNSESEIIHDMFGDVYEALEELTIRTK